MRDSQQSRKVRVEKRNLDVSHSWKPRCPGPPFPRQKQFSCSSKTQVRSLWEETWIKDLKMNAEQFLQVSGVRERIKKRQYTQRATALKEKFASLCLVCLFPGGGRQRLLENI